MKRHRYGRYESRRVFANKSAFFLEESFDGSLPRFLTAFSRRKRLSDKEIKAIERLIDEHKEG